jgi:hypothetical protein
VSAVAAVMSPLRINVMLCYVSINDENFTRHLVHILTVSSRSHAMVGALLSGKKRDRDRKRERKAFSFLNVFPMLRF